MKNLTKYLGIIVVSIAITSCVPEKTAESTATNNTVVNQSPIKSILTAEEQLKMSPDEIIGRLKKGNENFVSNNLTQRDHSSQRRLAMIG